MRRFSNSKSCGVFIAVILSGVALTTERSWGEDPDVADAGPAAPAADEPQEIAAVADDRLSYLTSEDFQVEVQNKPANPLKAGNAIAYFSIDVGKAALKKKGKVWILDLNVTDIGAVFATLQVPIGVRAAIYKSPDATAVQNFAVDLSGSWDPARLYQRLQGEKVEIRYQTSGLPVSNSPAPKAANKADRAQGTQQPEKQKLPIKVRTDHAQILGVTSTSISILRLAEEDQPISFVDIPRENVLWVRLPNTVVDELGEAMKVARFQRDKRSILIDARDTNDGTICFSLELSPWTARYRVDFPSGASKPTFAMFATVTNPGPFAWQKDSTILRDGNYELKPSSAIEAEGVTVCAVNPKGGQLTVQLVAPSMLADPTPVSSPDSVPDDSDSLPVSPDDAVAPLPAQELLAPVAPANSGSATSPSPAKNRAVSSEDVCPPRREDTTSRGSRSFSVAIGAVGDPIRAPIGVVLASSVPDTKKTDSASTGDAAPSNPPTTSKPPSPAPGLGGALFNNWPQLMPLRFVSLRNKMTVDGATKERVSTRLPQGPISVYRNGVFFGAGQLPALPDDDKIQIICLGVDKELSVMLKGPVLTKGAVAAISTGVVTYSGEFQLTFMAPRASVVGQVMLWPIYTVSGPTDGSKVATLTVMPSGESVVSGSSAASDGFIFAGADPTVIQIRDAWAADKLDLRTAAAEQLNALGCQVCDENCKRLISQAKVHRSEIDALAPKVKQVTSNLAILRGKLETLEMSPAPQLDYAFRHLQRQIERQTNLERKLRLQVARLQDQIDKVAESR